MPHAIGAPDRQPVGALAAFDALREPRYRRLWLAGLFLNSARWMDTLVVGWVVLELTGSPFMVGLAAFCRMAPLMLLGALSGVIADRFHRGRLLVAVQVVNLGAALAIALLFATGRATVGALIGIEIVIGIAWVVDYPVRRSALYTLVGQRRLTNAASLESVSLQGSKMIGPTLGGLLLGRFGPTACYFALALLFLASLLIVWSLHRRVKLPAVGSSGSVLGNLVTGLRDARAEPTLIAVLAITAIMNALVFPYQQMWPVLAREVFHVGPELLGLLVAADGLGALAGALTVASRRNFRGHRRLFAAGALTTSAFVLALAVSPWYLLSLAIQFLIGLGEAGFNTMQGAIVLLAAPDRARGRVLGILSACIGTAPLGTLWVGFLAGQHGAPLAVSVSAALCLLVMAPFAVRLLALSAHPLGAAREAT